jgi:hypothetical protein
MNKHRSNWMLVVVAFVIAVTTIACGTTAHIEKDETVNFNRYKTYSWVSEQEKPLKERNSNHLVDKQIKNAVAKQLERAGWVETKARPDVVLDYNILVENAVREQNNPVYSRPFTRYYYNPYTRRVVGFYYPSQMMGYESYEIPYKEGTITLHMIDSRTNKLVWQGWTSDAVNSNNLTSKEVNSSIKAILKKFDPKAEG